MRSLFLFIFITFFILVSISITEIYLKYLGLGDPVRYDSNLIYGYAPKINQKNELIFLEQVPRQGGMRGAPGRSNLTTPR